MSRPTLTEGERAERRRTDRERLERAVRELLTSDGWRRWVRVRSTNGLARYSFGNQLLIALQRPDATYVAGFRAFLALNRCVRKGEKAIRILAPMSIRDRDTDGAEGQADGEGRKRNVFRAVAVFDVAQTEALPGSEPAPLQAPCQPIAGGTHAHLLGPLRKLARDLGYSVDIRHVDGPVSGWCDSNRHVIVVDRELAANAQVRVLSRDRARSWSQLPRVRSRSC